MTSVFPDRDHEEGTQAEVVEQCSFAERGLLQKLPDFKGFFFFLRFYLFIFREGGRWGEREGEKHQCVGASLLLPTEDLAHTPGRCPDWESNQ